MAHVMDEEVLNAGTLAGAREGLLDARDARAISTAKDPW